VHQLPSGIVNVWPEYGRSGGGFDMPSPPHSEKPPPTVRHVGAVSQAVPLSPISPSPSTRRRLQLAERPSQRSTLSGAAGGLQTPSLGNDESSASTTTSSSSAPLSDDITPDAPFDMSAYYRRLERCAERDAHKARHSFEAARGHQREVSMAASGSTDRMSRAKLVRRHDQLREHRLRDMERRLRRLRRLERNGDVWLRSVVPLFESLNRLLEGQHRYDAETTAVGGWPSSSLPSLVPFPDAPSSANRYSGRSSSLKGHKCVSDQSLGSRSKSLHYPLGRQRHSQLQHQESSHSQKKRQSTPNPGELDHDRAAVRPWWKAEVPVEYPVTGTGGGAGSGNDYFNFRERLKRSFGGSKRFNNKDESQQAADEGGNSTGFEKLELLMRELQGAARFAIGGGIGGSKAREYHVPGM
jgi:hypothetical protein